MQIHLPRNAGNCRLCAGSTMHSLRIITLVAYG